MDFFQAGSPQDDEKNYAISLYCCNIHANKKKNIILS